MATKFSNTFEEFTLVEFLSNFSLPVSLGDLKELFENEVNNLIVSVENIRCYNCRLSMSLGSNSDGGLAVAAQTDCAGN